jgi:hypothetical protein
MNWRTGTRNSGPREEVAAAASLGSLASYLGATGGAGEMRIRASPTVTLGYLSSSTDESTHGRDSEDVVDVLTGGHSPHRSHSPIRRSNSRQRMEALEDRVPSPTGLLDSSTAGAHSAPFSSGISPYTANPSKNNLPLFPYSATPSKNKFLPPLTLTRIASGEILRAQDFEDMELAGCPSDICTPSKFRTRRLAHLLVGACIVCLLFTVSRAGSSPIPVDTATDALPVIARAALRGGGASPEKSSTKLSHQGATRFENPVSAGGTEAAALSAGENSQKSVSF